MSPTARPLPRWPTCYRQSPDGFERDREACRDFARTACAGCQWVRRPFPFSPYARWPVESATTASSRTSLDELLQRGLYPPVSVSRTDNAAYAFCVQVGADHVRGTGSIVRFGARAGDAHRHPVTLHRRRRRIRLLQGGGHRLLRVDRPHAVLARVDHDRGPLLRRRRHAHDIRSLAFQHLAVVPVAVLRRNSVSFTNSVLGQAT